MPVLTRKSRHSSLSKAFVKRHVTEKNYDAYLDKTIYFGEDPFKVPADDDYDPATGTCALHALFTLEILGFKVSEAVKQYKGFKLVTENNIDAIIKKLDSGSALDLIHVYRDKSLVESLPRNNVYDSHDFVLVKGGDKYFLSQGYQFIYKHSLKPYTAPQIRELLREIIIHTCDYTNTKLWKDLDLSYYKKYFLADLTVGKMSQLPVDPNKKVNGIVLEYLEIN